MKIFEFAVIYNPQQTKEKFDRGETPKSILIVDVQRVLANSENEVQMLAARAIPKEYEDKLELLTVAVRPF